MTNYVFVIVLFVGHAERGDVDHLFQVAQYAVGFFEDASIAGGDCREFGRCEIGVCQHLFEVVDVVAGYVAEHQDCLLNLAGAADKVVHRLQGIVIFFSLLVDLDRLLEVVNHILGGRRFLYE